MKTVYRVEDRHKIGPWNSALFYDIQGDLSRRFNSKAHEVHSIRTVNMQDYFIGDFLFGFLSMSDLTKYFGIRLIDKMKKVGFEINMYEADEKYILHGKGEIAFAKPGTVPTTYRERFAKWRNRDRTPPITASFNPKLTYKIDKTEFDMKWDVDTAAFIKRNLDTKGKFFFADWS